MSLNKAMIIGKLGKDPEVTTTPSGVKVAKFSVATNESYKDRNGNKVENTEWHNIVLWKGLAEIAEKYLHKGDTAFFEGKITTRSWEDKQGQKRYQTEIVCENVRLLGSKPAQTSSTQNYGDAPEQLAEQLGEPLPF